jgi:hypothetical protein
VRAELLSLRCTCSCVGVAVNFEAERGARMGGCENAEQRDEDVDDEGGGGAEACSA